MSLKWDEFLEIRFTPAEAEILTGVSTSLQRKWSQLHFGSDAHQNAHFDVSAGGHRRFTFSGLQRLIFFRDVSGDLGTRFGAGPIAKAADQNASQFNEAMTMLTHSDLFGADLREREVGDLFIYRSLVEGALSQFATATAAGLGKLLPTEWGARLYIYNVSLMQRTLAQAVQAFNSIEKSTGRSR